MRIAILGATSSIAKDLIASFSKNADHELILYARRPESVQEWLRQNGFPQKHTAADFENFSSQSFDAILNFVGVGDPARAVTMGAGIFDVTLKYDELALDYVRRHSQCRYVFMSSGAAYGARFDTPVDESTTATIAINNLQPQDWYGAAKLHAECRHRSMPELPIVDIRIFNYFSHTQDISARFLIADILRAIVDKSVLKTSPGNIVRDFVHPSDFHQLICAILSSPPTNTVVDCYSKGPVDKHTLLAAMQEKFNLQYEVVKDAATLNATGEKPHYYSRNFKAADFGYAPDFSSLDGIILESTTLLNANLNKPK